MREVTNISSIGLSSSDTMVLQSIFRIVQQLHDNFNLLEAERLDDADLVFVNADDEASLTRIKDCGEQITRIVISAKPQDNCIWLRRPIVLKRVLQTIENVCSTRSANENAASSNPVTSNRGKKHMRHLRSASLSGGGGNVLVVDDSFPVRKYMEQKLGELSQQKANLVFAGSGAEAVKEIKAAQFNAVFLDVVMPDVNGYKICKWIKTVQPQCKVIMLTGKKSPIDKVRGSMSGCDAYLTKPPSEQRLAEIYMEFIAGSAVSRATA